MSEIETMQRYVERTKIGNAHSYTMNMREMLALAEFAQSVPFEMICMAFSYGRSKGYRAAKAEVKRG